MDSPIYLLINVCAGIYSLILIYALVRGIMITIASQLREAAISVTMLFVGSWYLVEEFPYIIAIATVLAWIVYYKQLGVQARGYAKMQSKD